MVLYKVNAYNFRNFSNLNIDFKNINIITGENGSGKSNLLELIYYFFTDSSFKPVSDNQILNHKENFFSIKGIFQIDEKNQVDKKIIYILNKGKTIKLDEKLKNRFFYIPIIENKLFYNFLYFLDFRRKFFDKILSLVDLKYRSNIESHNKILKIKKDFYSKIDDFNKLKSNIFMLNEKLAQSIYYITDKRQKFFYDFLKNISLILNNELKNKNGKLSYFEIRNIKIIYKSIFKDLEFDQIKYVLDEGIEKEYKTERLFGNHVDGIYFLFEGKNIQNVLSLGQLKILYFVIIIQILNILKNKLNYKPPILIDDFFLDLDFYNVKNVSELIENLIKEKYQIFITMVDKNLIGKEREFNFFYKNLVDLDSKLNYIDLNNII